MNGGARAKADSRGEVRILPAQNSKLKHQSPREDPRRKFRTRLAGGLEQTAITADKRRPWVKKQVKK